MPWLTLYAWKLELAVSSQPVWCPVVDFVPHGWHDSQDWVPNWSWPLSGLQTPPARRGLEGSTRSRVAADAVVGCVEVGEAGSPGVGWDELGVRVPGLVADAACEPASGTALARSAGFVAPPQ